MANIKEDIIFCIKELIHNSDINIDDKTLLKEDLNIDSFRALALMSNLNRKGIYFKDGKIPPIKTLSDLVESVKYVQ